MHLVPGRVLVTGVAGFIGYHVASALLDIDCKVFGIDNMNDYYDPALKQARLDRLLPRHLFEFSLIDISDYRAVAEAFESFQPDVVIHLAAQAGVRYSLSNPRAYAVSNLDGFLSVLEACRATPIQHLVFASSSSVYGLNAKVPFSEQDSVDHPVSLYAATKRANELMAHSYAHLFGIKCTGLRFFTVYGPWGRPDMAYYKFTEAILKGSLIDVYAEEHLSRDFTYIDDIVDGIVRVMALLPTGNGAFTPEFMGPSSSTAPYRIFNIGNHTPVGLREFIHEIERATGRDAVKNHLPMQPGDVVSTFADVEAISCAVDFTPKTSLREGIERFVDWYRKYSSNG